MIINDDLCLRFENYKCYQYRTLQQIGHVSLLMHSNVDFPTDPFKMFISDKSTEAPKRHSLFIWRSHPTSIEFIFSAVFDAFDKANEPLKLFQKITIGNDVGVSDPELAKRFHVGLSAKQLFAWS